MDFQQRIEADLGIGRKENGLSVSLLPSVNTPPVKTLYSFRTYTLHQKPEERLDSTIQYLENHNNEVRFYILAQSRAQQQENLAKDSSPPAPCSKQQSQAIALVLKTPHKSGAPPPVHTPPPSRPTPPITAAPTAASNVRETVKKLEIFNEQARFMLAPYLAERERLKPRGLEVPEGFGQARGASGTYIDASRDPRVRR
ncbi:MAG: hypothetical protein Q9173_005007 [Seirophora scorigena]